MTERSGRPGFAPNAEVYDDAYYAAMYRPHWFLRNERKYRERDEALLRAVRPHAEMRLLEVGAARGDTAFFLAPRVAEVVGVDAAFVAVEAARAAGFAVDDLFFSASPYPLLGAVDRLFARAALCRFRTVLRALKPG